MGFIKYIESRFLGLTDPDDVDDMDQEDSEDEDEGDEDEAETGQRRGRVKGWFKKTFRRDRDEDDDDDESEESEPQPVQRQPKQPPVTVRDGNIIRDSRIVNVDPARHCERVVRVRQIDECREIIRYLLNGESVLLNLENVEPKDCGRIVDLLSGAAFALSGRMLKVAHLSYLLAPQNVDVIEMNGYGVNNTQSRFR